MPNNPICDKIGDYLTSAGKSISNYAQNADNITWDGLLYSAKEGVYKQFSNDTNKLFSGVIDKFPSNLETLKGHSKDLFPPQINEMLKGTIEDIDKHNSKITNDANKLVSGIMNNGSLNLNSFNVHSKDLYSPQINEMNLIV